MEEKNSKLSSHKKEHNISSLIVCQNVENIVIGQLVNVLEHTTR